MDLMLIYRRLFTGIVSQRNVILLRARGLHGKSRQGSSKVAIAERGLTLTDDSTRLRLGIDLSAAMATLTAPISTENSNQTGTVGPGGHRGVR